MSPKSPERNSGTSMSSPEDSHARISARPESEQVLKDLAAAFGLSSPVLLGRFDPDTFSLRMSQACLFQPEMAPDSERLLDSELFVESWPDSGMWDLGSAYELQTSEHPISEREYSSWPTASASIANDGESLESWDRRKQRNLDKHLNGNGMGTPLTIAATRWPTPNVPNGGRTSNVTDRREDGSKRQIDLQALASHWKTPHGMSNRDAKGKVGGCGGGEFALQANQWQTPATDSFRSRGGDRKDEMGLDQQARFFPTPAQRDYRTPNKRSYQDRSGTTKGEQLQNFVEHSGNWNTPHAARAHDSNNSDSTYLARQVHSLPDQQTQDGPQSSESGQTLPRRLNPRFVEWLLGFPITWTEL